MDTIQLEFALELRVTVAAIEELGPTPKGVRRVILITGGTFEGPAIRGEVVPGGFDWQIGRADGVTELEARYLLHTDDGVTITIVNQGLRHGPKEVMQRLAQGAGVDPSEYYFRSIPEFETADERYTWLNQSIFVATGSRQPDHVLIRVYKVL
ncbi:DUF3237 domain-containing protein [Telluribacter humicola]|uniref:DUF3237 domain-containing protein n=1 Tax=Telluribacter humicola TaxID=1720261 RepID=UPI00286E2397|nr:DUF3237 domain-containing protein [Telluribacter humicola]